MTMAASRPVALLLLPGAPRCGAPSRRL